MIIQRTICDHTEVSGRGKAHDATHAMVVKLKNEEFQYDSCVPHIKFFIDANAVDTLASVEVNLLDTKVENKPKAHRRTSYSNRQDPCECGYRSSTGAGQSAHLRNCEVHLAAIEAA